MWSPMTAGSLMAADRARGIPIRTSPANTTIAGRFAADFMISSRYLVPDIFRAEDIAPDPSSQGGVAAARPR